MIISHSDLDLEVDAASQTAFGQQQFRGITVRNVDEPYQRSASPSLQAHMV